MVGEQDRSVTGVPYRPRNRELGTRLEVFGKRAEVTYVAKGEGSDVMKQRRFVLRYRGDVCRGLQTVSPFGVLETVSQGVGLGATHFLALSSVYGEPSVVYLDRHEEGRDVSAEWYRPEFQDELANRMAKHSLIHGDTEILSVRDVEEKARRYLF